MVGEDTFRRAASGWFIISKVSHRATLVASLMWNGGIQMDSRERGFPAIEKTSV